MDYRWRLFRYRDIYDHENTERAFMYAIRKNIVYHRKHNPEYRRILKLWGFQMKNISCAEDLYKIPFLPTVFFKTHPLWSMKAESILVRATSSGTGGRKSRIGLDGKSLWFGFLMAVRTAFCHKLISPVPVNYLIMGYEPHKSNETVISKTQRLSTLMAPALHREYALKFRNGGYQLDMEGLRKALERYAKQPFPVRIIGFPAYLYFFLQELDQRGRTFQLPARSMVILGGGWKQFYKEKADKREVYRLIEKNLGIPEEHCREFFGAVEHPTVYCDCSHHHFHVPVYSRVVIRNVETLEPEGFGKTGLVNLITPLAQSMPLTSVVTDDLGILHEGKACGCGRKTPYFEIIGRIGMEEIKTCAAGAEEYINQEGRRNE